MPTLGAVLVIACALGAVFAAARPTKMLLRDVSRTGTEACNGYTTYCDCKLSQVLWIGAHNALTDAGEAVQRNQFVSGSELLEAGVRYFDVDTCVFLNEGKRSPPTVCHGYVWWRTQLYQPTQTGLESLKAWLDVHPREVIFLNFGDLGDFTELNDDKEATPTAQIRREIIAVVRTVFGSMAILRDDIWDAEINANLATLRNLIDSNRRVIVNIDKGASDSASYWGQDDRVCNDEWYPESLNVDLLHPQYDFSPAIAYVDEHMREPCADTPKLLNKLEFAFYTPLGGTIDTDAVGETLALYLDTLRQHNSHNHTISPYFPFNLILTDHSDQWRSYYPLWHRAQIDYLEEV